MEHLSPLQNHATYSNVEFTYWKVSTNILQLLAKR
jgi:hypothetical protein